MPTQHGRPSKSRLQHQRNLSGGSSRVGLHQLQLTSKDSAQPKHQLKRAGHSAVEVRRCPLWDFVHARRPLICYTIFPNRLQPLLNRIGQCSAEFLAFSSRKLESAIKGKDRGPNDAKARDFRRELEASAAHASSSSATAKTSGWVFYSPFGRDR